jgi:hypothetical protein
MGALIASRDLAAFGPDGFYLADQKWRTGVTLVALGGAIAWRTALDDVGNVNILAAQTHGLDHIGQQLAGASDERLTLLVFVCARGLADEHQISIGITDSEDDLLAALLVEAAAGAVANVFADQAEGGGGVGGCGLGFRLGQGFLLDDKRDFL